MSVKWLLAWGQVFNTFHAIGMMVLLGSIVIISLRLLGVLMPNRPVTAVARQVRYGVAIGLTVMLVTGPLMFLPEADRWYASVPFRVKMSLLATALVFHFTVFRRVISRDDVSVSTSRLTGAFALVLWYAVGWGGRTLTFL